MHKRFFSILFSLCVLGLASHSHAQQRSRGDLSSDQFERVYEVEPGDTLWDICASLLGDPFYWPKLWSLNQYIKNPHLIFPGDRLVFTPGTDSTFPNLEVVGQGQASDGFFQSTQDSFSQPIVGKNFATGQGVALRLANKYILTPTQIPTVGKITHSGEAKKLLVFGDRVFVDFKEPRYRESVQVGAKFYVIERIKKLPQPNGRGKVGYLVKKKAVVQVTDIRKSRRDAGRLVFEGIGLDSNDDFERGDELIEYRPEVKTFKPYFTDQKIDGHVVGADKEQIMISNNDYVFLNLGSKDGVKDGMQFHVVRSGDGIRYGNDKHLPDISVARIMVVETWDSTATGYVVTLDRDLQVGDRITTVVDDNI